YYVDEEEGQLKREAISPWARTHVEPISWGLAKVSSFAVEVLDAKSGWKPVFNPQKPFGIPLALRVKVRDARGEMNWDLPVFIRQ
ncbi:hypothetical protein JYT55_00970, partial [Mariprofundus ferrooxydans]|nr:hypothetical protein [Mariprofundus ferrooxydans]